MQSLSVSKISINHQLPVVIVEVPAFAFEADPERPVVFRTINFRSSKHFDYCLLYCATDSLKLSFASHKLK